MNRTICIDLDEVMFDFMGSFVPYIKEKTKGTLKPSVFNNWRDNWDSWNFYESFGLSREDFLRLYNEFIEDKGFATMKFLSHARRAINILHDIGCRIVFVTVRPPSAIKDTFYLLNANVKFHALYHVAQPKEGTTSYGQNTQAMYTDIGDTVFNIPDINSKQDVYKVCKPLVVIDDRYKYIEEAIEVGVPYTIFVRYKHNDECFHNKFSETNKETLCMALEPNWTKILPAVKGMIYEYEESSNRN